LFHGIHNIGEMSGEGMVKGTGKERRRKIGGKGRKRRGGGENGSCYRIF